MLMQTDQNNLLDPVYSISRRTSDIEKNYHSGKLELLAIVWAIERLRKFLLAIEFTENYHSGKLELLAIVWAIERLRKFLLAIEFTVITDCQALIYLNTNKTRSAQIVRWYNRLCEYTFSIKHRSGLKMQHVDALSRAPILDSECAEEEGNLEQTVYSILTRE
ncbi:RNase H-like domain found in reverse transcriptase [Popillia japonica]|uniref:RNase H-like domain found in reverse transcriptase n=1 Tax=Popillia japonica TaxID=7064 RepID=A0AAW1K3G2_POPJA